MFPIFNSHFESPKMISHVNKPVISKRLTPPMKQSISKSPQKLSISDHLEKSVRPAQLVWFLNDLILYTGYISRCHFWHAVNFVCCVEVLRPSQPNGVMSSVVSLPNHTFTGQAKSSNQYCVYSFAWNWQQLLPFLNQRKGENDRRKYFMIISPRKNALTWQGLNP